MIRLRLLHTIRVPRAATGDSFDEVAAVDDAGHIAISTTARPGWVFLSCIERMWTTDVPTSMVRSIEETGAPGPYLPSKTPAAPAAPSEVLPPSSGDTVERPTGTATRKGRAK